MRIYGPTVADAYPRGRANPVADGAEASGAESGAPTVPLDAPVLAVLPFDDLSAGEDQAYFADGLHEEVLQQLAVLFSPTLNAVEAWILLIGRRWAEAAKLLYTVRAANRSDPWTASTLSWVLARAGRIDEARALLTAAKPEIDDRFRTSLVVALASSGYVEAAHDQLSRAVAYREAGGPVSASDIAAGYAAVGETETALDWLERSFRHERGYYALRHPWSDPLRSEPRFRASWDELGLPGPEPS